MSLIKTDYVRLSKAAEMLQSDPNELLVAAYESRIRLFVLLDCFLKQGESVEWEGDKVFCSFSDLFQCGEMLRNGVVRLTHAVTDEFGCPVAGDIENDSHDAVIVGDIESGTGYIDVTIEHVYMRRADIEKIIEKHESPAVGSVPAIHRPQQKAAVTRRNDTLLTVIAALCNESGIDPQKPGTAGLLMGYTQELGSPVSEGTIKSILKQIPSAIEKRGK